MSDDLKLDSPADLRALIRLWIKEACEKGRLPFENGGVIVQMMQVWLKSYEVEKLETIEARVKSLEEAQKRDHK